MATKIPISHIPELLEIWDWETNVISPDELGKRSDKKVWWICPNGHDHYQQSPRQKSQGSIGCPKCRITQRVQARNAQILHQKGSILKTHPSIALEWDYSKNMISPDKVLAGSHTKYWWICKQCGRSYLMSPNLRSSQNRGCPACGVLKKGESKRKNLLKKYGSLAQTHPLIAAEWDYQKNDDTPTDVHYGMPDLKWWLCPYGHPSYLQAIRDRVRRGYGCPLCHGEYQTSFPEQALFYYLKSLYPDCQNRYIDNGFEIDIYIPQLKIGLEYDGEFWHRNKQDREQSKNAFFAQKGIRIIHIKEIKTDMTSVDPNVIFVKPTPDYSYINNILKQIASILGTTIGDINIIQDTPIIWESYLSAKKENSLQSKYPSIAAQWDFSKNMITPDKVSPYSRKKVYWICPDCGNNYQMVIGDRTGAKKCGCPKCGFQKRNNIQRQIKENNKLRIATYRYENPNTTIAKCARALGLSYPTVKKYWNHNI